MESNKLLSSALFSPTVPHPSTTRHKAKGAATAALLIQIGIELLDTSPTLRKRLGVTLTDLAAADKVRKELTKGRV